MRANTLFIPLGLLMILACTVMLAVLLTPMNFMIFQAVILGGLFLFYFLFKDITNVLIVWLLSLLFILFSKFSLGIDMPNISLDRTIWSLMVIYYIFCFLVPRQVSIPNRVTEIFMFILCGLAVFSVIRMKGISFSREILDTYSLLFNIYIVPFSVFLIAKDLIKEEERIRKLFIFLSVVLLYISITAIFENFKLTAFVFPKDIMNPGMGIHFGRARGPFLQAAINGTVLGMLSVINLYMAINTRLPYKIFFIIISFISPVAILFTYTRAAWLAILLSFMFMLVIDRRFRKYIGILILLALIILIPLHSKIVDIDTLASRSYSMGPIYDRINLYHTYMAMFMDRPIMGFGFANFNRYSHEYFSKERNAPYNIDIPEIHDTFSGTLVELGALGLIVFLSVLMSIFWMSIRLFRGLKEEGFLGKGFVVAFWGIALVYILNAFFIDMKNHQFQNVIFYLVAGIVAGLYQREIKDERHCE